VAIHKPGDFFGEGSLAVQPLRIATVTALSKAVVARLKAAIVRVLREEPAFSELFIASFPLA
jgi:CRP/FNR family cyclic AMP-dependent transcriptional regulator